MNNETSATYTAVEKAMHIALETYSNVHRGSGHNSMVTTHLFEHARDIILEYLGLNRGKYVVIFCTSRRAAILISQLKPGSFQSVSSQDIGLPLGVRAMAVNRKALPVGAPFQTGGGSTRIIAPGWVIWAKPPDKFEAGTPAIINIIAFAKALQMKAQFNNGNFQNTTSEKPVVSEILYHDDLDLYSGQDLLGALRQTLIGRNLQVPTVAGSSHFINMDNGASTPTFAPIWDTFCQAIHQSRPLQKEIVHEVKNICAGILGAPLSAYDVIFTSNTTEAINLAAESLSKESEPETVTVVLNTLMEHTSNELPWRMMPGLSLIRLSVNTEGFLDLNELEAILSAYNKNDQHGNKRIRLVAVSGASNVLGIFNNLAEISEIVHRNGARLMVDAAQLVAHRKVSMEEWGIDYLAFSAHKVYAPFGTGVLVVRKGLLSFTSAEMELILASGEENIGGIAALGKALVLLQRIGLDNIQEEEQKLTDRLLRGLAKIEGLKIYGINDPESPGFERKGGVVVFGLKKIMPNVIAKELAARGGIGIRYGCHCAHLLIKHLLKVPPALEWVQGMLLTLFPKMRLPGLARVSLGIENTEEEVDKLIWVLGDIANKSQNGKVPKPEHRKQMDDFSDTIARRVYS